MDRVKIPEGISVMLNIEDNAFFQSPLVMSS